MKGVLALILGIGTGLGLWGSTNWSHAEEPVPQPAASPSPESKVGSPKKKPVRREKEAEGNKAPNRFEADTVLKSRYKFDGKQLEVDPD